MAKLSIKADNLLFLSHHNPSSLRPRRLQLLPAKRRFDFRVCCRIKETEKVNGAQKVDGVPTGLRVDEIDRTTLVSDSNGRLSGNGKLGFDRNWPPWKNLPQRYKLIGTTLFAFVICNMDKVVYCLVFFLFWKLS